jgi:hypothetical protein
MIEDSEKAKLP